MKLNMKNKVVRIAIVALPVGLLAAMGLVFLWHCPEYHSGMLGGHWYVKHQLCWNVMGVVAFCMPLLAGWTRWLKLALGMAAAWLVMFAASQFCPQDGGGWFVSLGTVRLDVMGMFPFSLAMLLAWIANRFRFRVVRTLLVVGVSILLVLTAHIATNANRVSRLAAVFSGDPPTKELAENDSSLARAWAQKTCVEAIEASHWFSANEEYLKGNPLPGRYTSAMPASAALAFGKWFLFLVVVAFGFLGCCYARVWFATTDQGKKTFLAVSGLGVIIPATLGICECLGFAPMMYTCVPLVSYGGTSALMIWLNAGTLASIWSEFSDVGQKKDVRLDALAAESEENGRVCTKISF